MASLDVVEFEIIILHLHAESSPAGEDAAGLAAEAAAQGERRQPAMAAPAPRAGPHRQLIAELEPRYYA